MAVRNEKEDLFLDIGLMLKDPKYCPSTSEDWANFVS